jgi:hypothetical protein
MEQRPSSETIILRLHALVAHGYRPELGVQGCTSIAARHLGGGPDVVVAPDGQVLDAHRSSKRGSAAPIAIAAADDAGFQVFLTRLPPVSNMSRILAAPFRLVVFSSTTLSFLISLMLLGLFLRWAFVRLSS